MVASNRPAEGGLHCRPLPRPSAPPQQPPRPPPSWSRAASPSPSPRESPSWAGQWGANTNFFVVDSEQALVVDLLRFTSILSNFFSWGRVRRTKIIESEFHKKMTSLTRLCFSVYKYCNLCVCRPSCPLSRGFQTSSSWKAFSEVEARAPSVSQNYLKQTWLIWLNTSDKVAILFFRTKSSLRLRQSWSSFSEKRPRIENFTFQFQVRFITYPNSG